MFEKNGLCTYAPATPRLARVSFLTPRNNPREPFLLVGGHAHDRPELTELRLWESGRNPMISQAILS
jgi:hypothetical protein